MHDVRRLAAALLVIASQVLGGLVVLCDDGGVQHLELRANSCEPDVNEACDACGIDDERMTCRDTAIEALVPCLEPVRLAWEAHPPARWALGAVMFDQAPPAAVACEDPARLDGCTERLRSVVLLL